MTREELGNNISANIASMNIGSTNIEVTSAIMRDVDEYASWSRSDVQRPQVCCPVCGGEAIHALDVLARTIIRTPLEWDSNSNYHYEPVETLAAEIYDGFVYDGHGKKPAWTPGGNGLKQDEARYEARRRLRDSGHVPGAGQ